MQVWHADRTKQVYQEILFDIITLFGGTIALALSLAGAAPVIHYSIRAVTYNTQVFAQ